MLRGDDSITKWRKTVQDIQGSKKHNIALYKKVNETLLGRTWKTITIRETQGVVEYRVVGQVRDMVRGVTWDRTLEEKSE